MTHRLLDKIKTNVKCVIKGILELLPLQNIIIFESNPDFEDNTFWFYKYLVEQKHIHEKYKLVWFLADMNNARKDLLGAPIICVSHLSNSVKWRFLRRYYLQNAKLIIDCNRAIQKARKGQVRVFLTHGMPLKMPDGYNQYVGDTDIIPILGESFRSYHERFFKPDSIICSGFPRNQILYKQIESKEKFVFWLPTYRQHCSAQEYRIENKFPLGLPVIKREEDLIKIDETLQRYNAYLLIRLHPAQDRSIFAVSDKYQNIKIADDTFLMSHNIKLYELLARSAGLITDYSSVYYDYLEAGRPIGLTLEDADEYSKKWPLFFKDIQNELIGDKINTVEELLAFLIDTVSGRDRYKAERAQMKGMLGIEERDANEILYQNIAIKGIF